VELVALKNFFKKLALQMSIDMKRNNKVRFIYMWEDIELYEDVILISLISIFTSFITITSLAI